MGKSRFIACSGCGELKDPGGKARKATELLCRECRTDTHPSWKNIKKGCDCEPCTKYKQRNPVGLMRLYERDNWTCQLCNNPIDLNAEPTNVMAPALHDEGGDRKTAHRFCTQMRGYFK